MARKMSERQLREWRALIWVYIRAASWFLFWAVVVAAFPTWERVACWFLAAHTLMWGWYIGLGGARATMSDEELARMAREVEEDARS